MRYVSIDNVETGQHLGKSVYSGNGTILLSAGVQLTVFMINTLNRIGVTMIYIQDEQFADVEPEEILSEATKQHMIREMSDTFDAVRSGKEWTPARITLSVEHLLEDIIGAREVQVQLTDIKTADNARYLHAMNVCLLSAIIGMNIGMNQQQLRDLAIGALLHDVGKVSGSEAFDLIPGSKMHHTWRGFELIKSKRDFNLMIAHVALQHHERMDGTGQPRGLSHEEIHRYARIVTIANTYDNLITPKEHGGKSLLPHEACEEMMAMSGTALDHDLLVEFTRIISIYPNGTGVRLSTRETGVVVSQHRGLPGRPVVRIVRGSGDSLDVKEIDLANATTVFIEAVMN
ncbi:HD-GYP domain-containing protein [Paenibacillus dauci]|uniref:HD-GYP domain-containing protein n=1 Tax=Paenibacillus dauci TaxID=1567106 RepID=UPI0006198BA7|nr:HD domain-containing phosphohydrolase [Paenibacillus dauci]